MLNDITKEGSKGDLLRGAKQISKFLTEEIPFEASVTQVHYLVRKNLIPFGRLGPKIIIASKRQLRRHFETKAEGKGPA